MALLALLICAWAWSPATAGHGPDALATPDLATAPDKAAGTDKSSAGSVELVVGDLGSAWVNVQGFWRDLEYPGNELLTSCDGKAVDDLWVVGVNGVARYDGAWGPTQDLGGVLQDILVGPDGVVVCGNGGLVVRNTGDGWTTLDSGVTTDLLAIWGLAADDFWACGRAGTVVRYLHGEWLPQSPGIAVVLHDVWGAVGVGPYFVGAAGRIFKHGADGYVAQNSPTGETLFGIHGASATDIWAVGGRGKALRFDGVRWSDILTPADVSLHDVSVLPGGVLTVAGNSGVVLTRARGSWRFTTIADNVYLGGVTSVPAAEDQRWWDGFAAPPRGEGLVRTGGGGDVFLTVVHDGQLVVQGNFEEAGGTPARNTAIFDGKSWSPLGGVREVQSPQGLVSFAGDLVTAATWRARADVFRWADTTWERLAGLNSPWDFGSVERLVVATIGGEDRIYCTGILQHPDFPGEATIAWFDAEADAWVPLGQGLGPADYLGLTEFGGDLWAGGGFYDAPGKVYRGVISRLAGGDPAGTWETMPAPDHYVNWLQVHQGDLYCGGGRAPGVDMLQKYVPEAATVWQGQGMVAGDLGAIWEMRSWGERILAYGNISSVEGLDERWLVVWQDGVVSGLGGSTDRGVFASAVFEDDLYVGGFQRQAGGIESWGLSRWRDTELPPGPPVVDLTVTAVAAADVPLPVVADVSSYQTVRSATLAYRGLDTEDYVHLPMARVTGTDIWSAVVPGADIAPYGVQYFVTVQTDQATVFVPTRPQDGPDYVGLAVAGATWTTPASRQYEMFGFPFVPRGTTAEIMEGSLGPYDPARWRMERWDPGTGTYLPFPDVPPIAPGVGYWLNQAAPLPVTASGVTASTVGGVDVTVDPGWNMIAAPYPFAIDWTAVQRPDGIEDQLLGRVDDAYVVADQFVPWAGYFVHNTTGGTLVLNIPPEPAGKNGAVDTTPLPDLDWSLDIAATQGELSDLAKTVGAVVPDRRGPGNLHQPPYRDHDLALWTERELDGEVHRLRRDLRELDAGAVWNLVVRPAGGAGTVTLTFGGLDAVPADLGVSLATAGGTVDLRAAGGTWSGLVDGETRLRLVVGDPELTEEAARTLPRPFALLPNYPNPFNPQTRVVFTMPRAGQVTLRVYNVAGRLVRTLVDGVRPGGLNEVIWDGRDEGGREVASGVYFSRMQTEGFGQTLKMTLVR